MFHFKTLDEWHNFATSGSQPVIVERNEKEWIVHHRDGYEIQDKPENWKEVMAVVNCPNRAPIPASFAFVIKQLVDPKLQLDCWNPWPTLAQLKNDGLLMTMNDPSWITLQYKETTVRTDVGYNLGSIVAKWDRLGYEHDDLLFFASSLFRPSMLEKIDPWLGLMTWKGNYGIVLKHDDLYGVIVVIEQVAPRHVLFHDHFKTKELVQLFNDGDVPPQCVTAWDPFYTAAEALPLLQKAYGTPEFEKLRFHNGKLRRSP